MELTMLPDIISRESLLLAANESGSVTFLVDAGDRIVYCNPAWDDFAIQNGAPELADSRAIGINLFAVIPKDLQHFYQRHLSQVRGSGQPWDFTYECSSPEIYRTFRMRVYPLRHRELFVTNTVVINEPHLRSQTEHVDEYLASGIATMCAHCRCAKNKLSGRWDYVPALVRSKHIPISHGLCRTCREYFYPSHTNT